MGLPIRGLEAPGRDVRVDLGGGEVLVPQQLLDDAQVGSTVKEVCRERVAERVRRDADRKAGTDAQAVEPIAQAADTERSSEMVQENLDGRGVVGGDAAFDEHRAAVLEVRGQRGT